MTLSDQLKSEMIETAKYCGIIKNGKSKWTWRTRFGVLQIGVYFEDENPTYYSLRDLHEIKNS